MNNSLRLLFVVIIVCCINTNAQDKFEPRRLTFDEAQNGFATWSPDGKSIVYQYTDMRGDTLGKNGLWVTSPDGTGAKQIFKGLAEHAKWSPDGSLIVFDADTGNSIKMIPAGGGDAISFLPDSIHIQNGGLPCWSPDGLQIAFLERSGFSICVYNMKTGSVKSIFSKEGMIPLPGCWSEDGKYVLVGLWDKPNRKSTMRKVSSDGKEQIQITGHHENFFRHLALSPDGSLLVYAALEGKYLGLWIMHAEGGKSIPLAVTPKAHNEGACWSPDGKSIAFNSTRSGNFDVWLMKVDIEQLKKELKELNE
jgi:Tol biopolymer transport system component